MSFEIENQVQEIRTFRLVWFFTNCQNISEIWHSKKKYKAKSDEKKEQTRGAIGSGRFRILLYLYP